MIPLVTLARAASDPRVREFLHRQAEMAEREAPVLPSTLPIVETAPAAPVADATALTDLAGALDGLGSRLDAVEQRKAAERGLTDDGAARLNIIMAEQHVDARAALAVLDREEPPTVFIHGVTPLSPVAASRAEPVAEDAVALLLRGDDDEFLRRMVGTAGSNSVW